MSVRWSLCLSVCLRLKERQSKRERAEISIKGEDYPVRRLPATRSFSPPLTPSLPHSLSHHPQYWRGLSEQVIRGEPTKLTQTQCLNNLLWSGLPFSFSCLLCKYVRIFFLNLPFYLLFFGDEVFLHNVIFTWRCSMACLYMFLNAMRRWWRCWRRPHRDRSFDHLTSQRLAAIIAYVKCWHSSLHG